MRLIIELMSIRFKLIIFLFHLLLLAKCQSDLPQNQLPQQDPVSQTENSNASVISQSAPSTLPSSQDSNLQDITPVTSETNPLAQKAPAQASASPDDYEHLPVNLDDKDPS
jgi:hypothetical protein